MQSSAAAAPSLEPQDLQGDAIYTAPRPALPTTIPNLINTGGQPFAEAMRPYPRADYDIPPDGKPHQVDFTYDPDGHDMTNLTLVGSWDNSGHYNSSWDQSATPMWKDDKGLWHATVTVVDDAQHPWQWGVRADAPTGKQQWAIFDDQNPTFQPQGPQAHPLYEVSRLHSMGVTHQGNDLSFKYWAPDAQNVGVRMWGDDPSKFQMVPMQQDGSGHWQAAVPGGWAALKGQNYAYQVQTAQGQTVLRSDPYGRVRQGQQRSISEVYLASRTGQEVTTYFVDPEQQQKGLPSWQEFIRFEVQGHTDAQDVSVSLSDDSGHVLTKDELAARLGATDASLVSHYHNDKFNDFYTNHIDDQGRIHLVQQGGAWGAMVNNPQALAGLHYRIEIRQPDGTIVGDTNHDGTLGADEAKKTAFNDPYSNVISPNYGWDRYNVITDGSFDWQNDNAPRMATDRNKMVIYQLHVGSFMGDSQNVHRSTFQDVMNRLQYLKDMGVNTIEMLPVNQFTGTRDWGYAGTNSMAVADQYGFEDKDGRWVNGREALCRLIDAAHGMGFNVYNDLVYNHWGGDYNDMWDTDSTSNPYFNWNPDAKGQPQLLNNQFGPLPAYNNPDVRQFIADSALQQLDDLHFDDLRFDYTHPIHDDNGGGGLAGWTLLRRINRELHFFHPGDMTNAEEFPNANVVSEPVGPNLTGGAGFDTEWDTEYQHVLVHRNGYPDGALSSAAHGWQTNMDAVMNQMTGHPGFDNSNNAITVISDHDEVGNGDRMINLAMGESPYTLPTQWARNADRTTFGTGMLSPGIPIYFQGDESMATNRFTWDVPSTWDLGWDWLNVGQNWDWSQVDFNDAKRQQIEAVLNGQGDASKLTATDQQVLGYLQSLPPEQRAQGEMNIMRKEHARFCKDVTHLRTSSPAFDADAAVNRVYTHNQNSVMAFTRQKGGDTYLVVSSLNKNDMPGYNIPTPDGRWQLVLDSDDPQYGGNGVGLNRPTVSGNGGTQFDLPAGGMLVYKKVG